MFRIELDNPLQGNADNSAYVYTHQMVFKFKFCRTPAEFIRLTQHFSSCDGADMDNECLKTRNVNTVGHIGFGYLRLS